MKKAFLAYFTLGYPDIKRTEEIIKGAIRGGASGIEIGLPFSDPVADGPIIQHAHNVALSHNTKPEDIFPLLDNLGPMREGVDFYIMAYLNTIINAPSGMENFIKKAKGYGIKGFILPDLPFSEIKRGRLKIDFSLVLFATPDTEEEKLKEYDTFAPPFIYYIARYGTTGERDDLPEELKEKIQFVKNVVSSPIYIGFGISKPEHVKMLYEVADGVIVGSHLIRLVKEKEDATPEVLGKIIEDEVKRLLS